MIEAPVEIVGVKAKWSAEEARDIYNALYHMNERLGCDTVRDRVRFPDLAPLFTLYDQLHEEGIWMSKYGTRIEFDDEGDAP